MKTIVFSNTIEENDINLAIGSIQDPTAIARQIRMTQTARKKASLKTIGQAVAVITFAFIYLIFYERVSKGWATFFLLIVSICLAVFYFIMLLRGIKQLAEAIFQPASIHINTSLVEMCDKFYYEALCRMFTLDLSRENIDPGPLAEFSARFSRFFPSIILEKYAKTGWSTFDGSPYLPTGPSISLACENCHKKVHSAHRSKIFQLGSFNSDSMFARCDFCGKVLCYSCGFNIKPNESRAFCPACGEATGGWAGLALRWAFCMGDIHKEPFDLLEISDINIKTTTREDPRVFNIDIDLIVKPGICVKFNNVAIKVDENHYLISPEPGLPVAMVE
jgi:hypothetical protein